MSKPANDPNDLTKDPNYGPSRHITDTHVFFYGYELQIPESRLQQWYPASFVADDIRYQTAEHYQMYQKAILMKDKESAEKVLNAATPAEARTLGRGIKPYDGELWTSKVDEVVERGNWLKFSQVKECREALLGTGNKVLVEASPVDDNFGIGFRGDEAVGRESEWGRNRLGKALMKVRERLRKENL